MRFETRQAIRTALREDRAGSDVTSRLLVPPDLIGEAEIVAKQEGVACGLDVAARVFRKLDSRCRVRFLAHDGREVRPGTPLLRVRGKVAKLLAAERTAVNFIQHFSGVASLTRRFVRAVRGTNARIYDTRKTVPGLRKLQKYAVRCGGGMNHRMGLEDMAMVKDNHLRLLRGSPQKLLAMKSSLPKRVPLVIEAKTTAEVRLALRAQADVVLLDNMPPARMRRAIRLIRSLRRPIQIEVSGGVTLKTVGRIARLGVDRISVGALTHSAPALDVSLEVR